MIIQDDSGFFIKPNAFAKLYKQAKPRTSEQNVRKSNSNQSSKKKLNILHFSKPLFLLHIPDEPKSNRNNNQTCRSWNSQGRTPEGRRRLMCSPHSRVGPVMHYQDIEMPYEIHSQLPVSNISPKYMIQQKQGCTSRLPNFKLQLVNQLPGIRMMKE